MDFSPWRYRILGRSRGAPGRSPNLPSSRGAPGSSPDLPSPRGSPGPSRNGPNGVAGRPGSFVSGPAIRESDSTTDPAQELDAESDLF